MAYVQITFEGVEEWENNHETVDNLLEEFTGTYEYPTTRTLPPMILGVSLDAYGIEQLRALQGVTVIAEDDD